MSSFTVLQNCAPYSRFWGKIVSRNFRTCSHLQFEKPLGFSGNLKSLNTEVKNGACYDFVIVGGGIVGCATAMDLAKRFPTMKMALLEKEAELAMHQSGHNSGVVHAGIYYKVGSLKAKLCVEGLRLSYEYFAKNGIPYKKCGKLIVAIKPSEISRLKELFERGLKNNVAGLKLIDGQQIKQYEPHCKGLMAISSPETGIVDYKLVTESYAYNFTKSGGTIHTNFPVIKFQRAAEGSEYPVLIFNNTGKSIRAKYVLTCGGLHSDRLSEMSGGHRSPRIVPFRGEYLLLNRDKCYLINGNIYPVPNPRFPFLGVHFTPRMDGSVWLGPNAVLAFKREGYSWFDFDIKDFWDTIRSRGFQKLALKNVGYGMGEMVRSAMPNFQLAALQQYIPEISPTDVTRGPTGVRAQAMNDDGSLVDDFIFDSGKGDLGDRILHVRNSPSPAATSALAISKMILGKVTTDFVL